MGFGPKMSPPAIPLPPPAAHSAILGSDVAALSGGMQGKKAKAASGEYGFGGTVATSPQGLKKTDTTAKATLLG